MKKKIAIFIAVLSIFMLAGCGNAPPDGTKGKDKEKTISKILEASKTLTTVHEEGSVETYQHIGGEESKVGESFIADAVYESPLKLTHFRSVVTTATGKTESIITPEGQFGNNGTVGWVKFEPGNENLSTTYAPLFKVFIEIAPDLKMEKSGNDYVFSFKGCNENIYKKIAPNFQMNIQGVEERFIDLDITYVIDGETHYLKEVNHKVSVEGGEDKVSITGKVQCSNHNAPVDIVPPTMTPVTQ